ncbi:hypothetical protein CASFOL_028044 [Castilleja foliolosa]|uniref:Uncharacterized protein n=1 Tax=Castilleja foliolosa TaxID=1961234 RepID=A0ABD3CHC1_9LAMI
MAADHKEKNLGKGMDIINDREFTSKAKKNYTTTLDIIKGKIDKNRINKLEELTATDSDDEMFSKDTRLVVNLIRIRI